MPAPVIVRISQQTVVRESDGATLLLLAGYIGEDRERPASLRVIEPPDEPKTGDLPGHRPAPRSRAVSRRLRPAESRRAPAWGAVGDAPAGLSLERNLRSRGAGAAWLLRHACCPVFGA